MKTFRVIIQQFCLGEVIVDAKDSDKAMELAYKKLDEFEAIDDETYEIISVIEE